MIISWTQCLRTEKEHPSASSRKLAKASEQLVKAEGQRVAPPGRQHTTSRVTAENFSASLLPAKFLPSC
jgi:hypothetical protein